jgi:hypothetical protein
MSEIFQVLEQLCGALYEENPSWQEKGCSIEEIFPLVKYHDSMALEELDKIPGLLVDWKLKRVFFNKRKRPLLNEGNNHLSSNSSSTHPSPKRAGNLKKRKVHHNSDSAVLNESKICDFESSVLTEFLQNHFVNEIFAARANRAVANLSRYLKANFQEGGLFVSVHLVGSFASGLASRTESLVDVIVKIDGGELTQSLDSSSLNEALMTALENCPFFASILKQKDHVKCLVDYSLALKIRAYNSQTFPLNFLHHARMLASVTRVTPCFPILLSYVKSWAAKNNILNAIGNFQWTLIVLSFLVNNKVSPSPLEPLPGSTREFLNIYGESYYYVSERPAHDPLPPRYFGNILTSFFVWLGSIDLLSVGFDVSGIFPQKGWLVVLDPTTKLNTCCFSDGTSLRHRDIIKLCMTIKENARQMLLRFR